MSIKKYVSVEESQNLSHNIAHGVAKAFSFGLNLAILFMYFSLLIVQLVGCILVGLKLGGVLAISWQVATIPFMVTAFSVIAVIVIYVINEHFCNRINMKNN